jgi:hypothetical protein
VLSRTERGSSPGHPHLDLEPDQLRREAGGPPYFPLRRACLHDEDLALDVAEGVQALPGGLQIGIRPSGRVATGEPPIRYMCVAGWASASGATKRARVTRRTMRPDLTRVAS